MVKVTKDGVSFIVQQKYVAAYKEMGYTVEKIKITKEQEGKKDKRKL